MKLSFNFFIVVIIVSIAFKLCCPKEDHVLASSAILNGKALLDPKTSNSIIVNRDITVEHYFKYIDSIVKIHEPIRGL